MFLLGLFQRVWKHITEGLLYGRQKADNENGIQEEAVVTETPQEHASREGLLPIVCLCLSPPPQNVILSFMMSVSGGALMHPECPLFGP